MKDSQNIELKENDRVVYVKHGSTQAFSMISVDTVAYFTPQKVRLQNGALVPPHLCHKL